MVNALPLKRIALSAFCVFVLAAVGCKQREQTEPDHPRLSSNVTMRDVTFRSRALNRDMQYRAILPANPSADHKLPVVYLLHGGGGGFHDWSNYIDLSPLVVRGIIAIMPEGNNSYYTNSAGNPQDRYEDYIVQDLIADVESKFPAASGRLHRAIVGVSMGGYGAIKIALRHPDLYVFAGGVSPALDVPTRRFSIKRIAQWRFHSSIFGPTGSTTRHDNDPFVLAGAADPNVAPFLYTVCGNQEGLLATNRSFADLLSRRHFSHEFHIVPGGHNWEQWDRSAPDVFIATLKHLSA
jgi:S-formylglutathione hydrolase FrmB